MEYRGYTAKIEFDEEDDTLRGEVIGLRDFIVFEGKSVAEIRKSFRVAVDDYLEYCKSRGEEPDKPYSGNFPVRMGSDLHRKISCQAQKEGKSLNAWVETKLSDALEAEQNKLRQAVTQEAVPLKLFSDLPERMKMEAQES
jgi:predicted HicB family RNase H-like nuclease